jgi:ATP-dependent Clp protease ATP-binding subunit ClpA
MLSRELEQTLRRALACANVRHHRYATLEHLLLALLDDPDASDTLLACGADIEHLHSVIADYLNEELTPLRSDESVEASPDGGFQRVVQKSAIHVQELGRSRITGANVLVELFSEPDSWAVGCLAEQGIGRLEVVRVIVEQRDDLKEPS